MLNFKFNCWTIISAFLALTLVLLTTYSTVKEAWFSQVNDNSASDLIDDASSTEKQPNYWDPKCLHPDLMMSNYGRNIIAKRVEPGASGFRASAREIVTKRPLTLAAQGLPLAYYEVKVVKYYGDIPEDRVASLPFIKLIQIGLTRMGHGRAYHFNSFGALFLIDGFPEQRQPDFGPSYGENDTIGCGLLAANEIFFTKNGEFIASHTMEVYGNNDGPFYPILNFAYDVDNVVVMEANFGDDPQIPFIFNMTKLLLLPTK